MSRIYPKLGVLFCITISQVFGSVSAFAETSKVAVIDQLVLNYFMPSRISILQEVALGKVLRYPAYSLILAEDVTTGKQNSAGLMTLLVGAAIYPELTNLRKGKAHYTFFLAGEAAGNRSFSATPIRRWSKIEVDEYSKSTSELEKTIVDVHKETAAKVKQIKLRDVKLKQLRERVAQVAGVDGIVELKMELAKLRAFDSKDNEIQGSLVKLVEVGRQMADPENAKLWRKSLAEDLRGAAEVTAMADRLAKRRRQAALKAFKSQSQLIKAMKDYDPQMLARKLLKLRKKRRELEGRLNLSKHSENLEF